jgi:hypothetical protein
MAAGDAVVKGANAFTEQPKRHKFVQGRGWFKIREWHGPLDETKIATQIADILALGTCENITVTRDWPTTIEASFPAGDNFADESSNDEVTSEASAEWTLEPYDLEKPLGTHGQFNASGNSGPCMAAIDRDLKAGSAVGVDYHIIYPSMGAMNEYADLKGHGVESWLTFGYTLRKTITTDSAFDLVRRLLLNAKNLGKVITWDEIGVPADSLIQQPWAHIYASTIDGFTKFRSNGPGGWADVYFDEWLVKPPAVTYLRQGAVRKRQIRQEYLGALAWSETLYHGGKGKP